MEEEVNNYQFCIQTEALDEGGSLYQDNLLVTWVIGPRLRIAGALQQRYNVESCDAWRQEKRHAA